jgi:hypothetical protein
MEGEMKNWLAGVSAAAIAGFAVSAVADDDDRNQNRQKRVFRAELVGLNEVPSVSTPARGQFYAVVNAAGTAFTYWLSYSDLAADAAQSHIHFGQHHTNGGISVWLCQGTVRVPATLPANVQSDTPECAVRSTTQPITATISADDVVGPAGQGIGLAEFAELLAAMRAGAAYANVHSGVPGNPNATPPTQTVGFPPGEIRGQLH